MSTEETPIPTPPSTNGNGAPIKLSFGTGKGLSLAKKNAPLVKKISASAFGHHEEPTESHKDELIVGLEGNKIESLERKEEAKPLVIPKLDNVDWRQQMLAKRKKTYVPEESLATPMDIIEEPEKEIGYGLQIKKRTKIEEHIEHDKDSMEVDATTTQVTEDIVTEKREETLEEQAARKIMQAVSGERPEDARNLVVHGEENIQSDDLQAFQKSLGQLPDESTLEEYEKVPVEEFGAALLRGMGWKEGTKGSEAIEFNRRPALLGLGAKPKEPEPITKKYIKPGESRTPAAVKVPERHRTGHSSASSHKDSRDSNRDSRDSRNSRDSKDSRDSRSDRGRDRDSRDHRGRMDRDSNDNKDSRDSRDHRHDHKESRSSREERDDRHRGESRREGGERRREDRDRDRDRERDRHRGDRDRSYRR